MRESASFWDREVVTPQHITWLEEPAIHQYANTLIGRGTPMWPVEWFGHWSGRRCFDRALSIGCGTGALERGLIRLGMVRTIDAFDGSLTSLHLARTEAAAIPQIRYFASDFNNAVLPRATYDLVLFHQSAHHVEKLERLFSSVLRALRANGLLYLDEYVGPSRFDWNERLIAPQRRFFDRLPDSLKIARKIPYPIQADDPSEAVRSSEIESRVQIGFEIVERRPYGGTFLAVVYPFLRREALTPEVLIMLMEEEKKLLDAGSASYYSVFVARPRVGFSRVFAMLRYAVAGPFALLRLSSQKIAARVKRFLVGKQIM